MKKKILLWFTLFLVLNASFAFAQNILETTTATDGITSSTGYVGQQLNISHYNLTDQVLFNVTLHIVRFGGSDPTNLVVFEDDWNGNVLCTSDDVTAPNPSAADINFTFGVSGCDLSTATTENVAFLYDEDNVVQIEGSNTDVFSNSILISETGISGSRDARLVLYGSGPDPIAPDNFKGVFSRYSFDEADIGTNESTPMVDTGLGTDNITLNNFNNGFNNASSIVGILKEARDFDGSDNFYNSNEIVSPNSTFIINPTGHNVTVSLWVKPDDTGEEGVIFDSGARQGQDTGIYIGVDSGENLQVQVQDDNNDFDNLSIVHLGADWAHIMVYYDGTDVDVYVNGTLETTIQPSAVPLFSESSNKFRFGQFAHTQSPSFNYEGAIDEACIYKDEVMGAANATVLYNNGIAVNCITLEADLMQIELFLNGTPQNITIPENQSFAVYHLSTQPATLQRNGTTIGNNSVQSLPFGYYNYTVFFDSVPTTRNALFADVLEIIQSTTTLFINGTTGDFNFFDEAVLLITAEGTGGNFTITQNGTPISNNSLVSLTLGSYEFVSTIMGAELLIGSSDISIVTISSTPPPPEDLSGFAGASVWGLAIAKIILFILVLGFFVNFMLSRGQRGFK